MANKYTGGFDFLTDAQKKRIVDLYATDLKRSEVQKILAKELDCNTRNVRKYAKILGLNVLHQNTKNDRILIYDIETSRVQADLWWTGKQYVTHQQLSNEPRIISISWKWLGTDKVHSLTWNDGCDKKMVEDFLKEYNKASMVIGQNNNSFDNKWITTRAAKHKLFVDRFVKSFDIYRMAKSVLRLPSYSMEYMAKYFGLTPKQSHEGIIMWDKIEKGTDKEKKEYLKKMVEYNIGDIITTEELYLTLRPYFKTVTNRAVSNGQPKWCCPISGNNDVSLLKTIFTEMGTIQRILYCKSSNHQYKVSNKTYMDFLQRAIYGYK